MDRLAENDFSARADVNRQDELGELAESVGLLGQALARVDVLRKEVIANVSHELRSPLSVISGYAELVRDIHWKDEAARNEDARKPPRLTGSGSALTLTKSPCLYTPTL